MTTKPPHPVMDEYLINWFQRQLNDANADFEREPLSYDGHSEYDHLCYGLVREAERLCRLRFGQAPSGCQLQRALATAEFKRTRSKRQRQQGGLIRRILRGFSHRH